jgi:hypothetical protein
MEFLSTLQARNSFQRTGLHKRQAMAVAESYPTRIFSTVGQCRARGTVRRFVALLVMQWLPSCGIDRPLSSISREALGKDESM